MAGLTNGVRQGPLTCVLGPVNTHAGRLGLPLLHLARALQLQADQQAAYRAVMGSAWPESGLMFTTRTGQPIEPRNLVRSFRRICDTTRSGSSRSIIYGIRPAPS